MRGFLLIPRYINGYCILAFILGPRNLCHNRDRVILSSGGGGLGFKV